MRIFRNKFKRINLYRLRHIHEFQFDSLHDKDRIGIEDGTLKLRKMSRTYNDFGKSFYDLWADAFHNYTTILVFVFGKEVSDLYSALTELYTNIYKLSQCMSGKKPSSRWPSRPTPLLLPSNPQTRRSGSSRRNSKKGSVQQGQ